MTKPTPEPLRGDAAWRAQKAEIDKRNDAARKAGAERRATQDAQRVRRQMDAARMEASNLPEQPEP